jgi:STE24 endopeptidase
MVSSALDPYFIPGLVGLATIFPFLVATVVLLFASYRVDRSIRDWIVETTPWATTDSHWTLRVYLEFHIRHSLLTVVVPTTLILICYDLATHYEDRIIRWFRVPYAADLVLGAAACLVFILAPWILKHVWPTESLPDGPLRRDLERILKRVRLRCRDILVWKSGGMTVNAAVMGLVAPLRYVMLSDGLLKSMPDKQIEAVFGHEAGHVKHRHIQFFLLFAFASMLVSSGLMELLYRMTIRESSAIRLTLSQIQLVGFGFIVVIWGAAFGFVSRRFEQQADLFGARCVTPNADAECTLPCGVHADGGEFAESRVDPMTGLCATGASVFTEALRRVATLNGIPLEEPSWRHSSLADRIESLARLSSDPRRLASFEALIRRIKRTLLFICVVGTAISIYYIRIDFMNAATAVAAGGPWKSAF